MMPQISKDDKIRIEAWNNSSKQTVQLQVITSKDPQSLYLERFCDQLAQIAPRISVRESTGETEQGPQIRLAGNIRYSAVPQGSELVTFLKVLNGLHSFADRLPVDLQARAKKIDVPAPVKVYIAPSCPHCHTPMRFEGRITALKHSSGFLAITRSRAPP